MLALFFGAGTNTLQAFTRCFLYLSGVAVSPYDRSFSFTLQTERIQMPVFKSGKGQAPARCEMEYFEIVNVPAGGSPRFERTGTKEKLIVGAGACCVIAGGHRVDAETGTLLTF